MRTGFPFTGTQHALGHWLSKPQAGICPFILPCIYNLAQLCRAQPAQPYSVALTPNTWRLSHQGPGQEEASEGSGPGQTRGWRNHLPQSLWSEPGTASSPVWPLWPLWPGRCLLPLVLQAAGDYDPVTVFLIWI
jgi:hypothetical protein